MSAKRCVRASLAPCKKPTNDHHEWKRQNEVEQQLPHHARYFLQESSMALAYLSFPLMEAITKKVCSGYVDMDGTVLSPFNVMNKYGVVKEYDPAGRWNQKQCSSLRDLLSLLYGQTADAHLRATLTEFKAHIATLDNSQDPFDVLYQWRNQSLHGTTSFQTIGGTLLNLVLAICIHQLKNRFEDIKPKVIEQCRWEAQNDHKSPWSFYPPYKCHRRIH